MSRIRTIHACLVAALAGWVAAMPTDRALAEPATAETAIIPDVEALPAGMYGDLVRYGKTLVDETYRHVGPQATDPAMRYAGNNLNCRTCHLDSGAQVGGASFLGTFADFPQYRKRENAIGTLENRINGCMQRSMNGRSLPVDGTEMKAFLAYMKFMSTGVPVGTRSDLRGIPKIKAPARAANPVRGEAVYAENCASCHGDNGLGKLNEDTLADGYLYPPLWGDDSFNTGAGMHRVLKAASFIKYNMPLGATANEPQLSNDDAYDVAAYINSKPRPVKPGIEKDFPDLTKKPVDFPYPPFADSFSAEQHKYGPFQPIIAARKQKKAAQN